MSSSVVHHSILCYLSLIHSMETVNFLINFHYSLRELFNVSCTSFSIFPDAIAMDFLIQHWVLLIDKSFAET